jgi:hypothetical protein
MLKKSISNTQHGLFSSPQSLLSGKSLKIYDDQSEWHNVFRNQVTMRIDEEIFRPLYTKGTGSPSTPVRILIAMVVLKEAEELSDKILFESCRFNMLTRSAIGLLNMDQKVPTDSTYYLFPKQIDEYAKEHKENLIDIVFSQLSKDQCLEFDVTGKRIRMDKSTASGQSHRGISWAKTNLFDASIGAFSRVGARNFASPLSQNRT